MVKTEMTNKKTESTKIQKRAREPCEEEACDSDVLKQQRVEATNKQNSIRRNKKIKYRGYRALARQVGYCDSTNTDAPMLSGKDGMAFITTVAENKRLMCYKPATVADANFGLREFTKRHEIFAQGVSRAAACVTRPFTDAALREIVNEAVLRASENGLKTVTASILMSILRPYAERMIFTAVIPPVGLIRHAQEQGVLGATDKDKELQMKEKNDVVEMTKISDDWDKEVEARRLERNIEKKAASEDTAGVSVGKE